MSRDAAAPEAIMQMGIDLTVAAACLDYVSSSPARWEAFLAFADAVTGIPTPELVTRENASAASPRLAGVARALIGQFR